MEILGPSISSRFMHSIRIDNVILQVHRPAKSPIFSHVGTAKYYKWLRSGIGKKTAMCVDIKSIKKYTRIVKICIGDLNYSMISNCDKKYIIK